MMAGRALLAALALAALPVPAPAAPPVLTLPLDCAPGRDCFVQNYVDHMAGPPGHDQAARDWTCGARSYPGHDGTDIRLPDLPDLADRRRGVAVLAAAPGRVIAIRDGEADHPGVPAARLAVARGRECGNGVLIDHGDGWQTQYCHLARGSVAVVSGQVVERGERLGLVGVSGASEFPHLHLAVRHDGRALDPFAPGLGAGQCGAGGAMLWSDSTRAALAYRPTEIIRAVLSRTSGGGPVLAARVIGLRAGDRVRLRILGPDDRDLVDREFPISRDLAEWNGFAATRPSATATARWRGWVEVLKVDATILIKSA